MKMNRILILCLVILAAVCGSVFAEEEVPAVPFSGAWMLDRVYEDASGADRRVLDPETSASLYAETANVYFFNNDGTAEMQLNEAGEIIRYEDMTWKEAEGMITLYSGEDVELEVSYDPEENTLHRYWKEDAPNAMYHDLDFTYVRVPVGAWQMTYVVSSEPGKDPVRLDPENAGSLYAESVNVYTLQPFGVMSVSLPEDVEETGTWKLSGDELLLTDENGFEMTLKYDAAEGALHRYWQDDAADVMYHNLDFVYLPL